MIEEVKMSKSMDMIFIEEIDKFLQQNGIYPEKVIMNKGDYCLLLKGVNQWKFLTGGWKELKEYKRVKIEVDDKITDWILVAPEHN